MTTSLRRTKEMAVLSQNQKQNQATVRTKKVTGRNVSTCFEKFHLQVLTWVQ